MPASTAEVFKRSLMSRWQVFKGVFDSSIAGFGGGVDGTERTNRIIAVAKAAEDLRDLLASEDRPGWLKAVLDAAVNFRGTPSPDASKHFLNQVLYHFHQIQPIELTDESADYNFDKVFEELRTRHQLTDLFDRLSAEMTAIIESGELESVTAIERVQRMAAALRANRSGSLSAMKGTFSFVGFGWNLTVQALQRVPILKELVNATEKTLKEGSEKMNKVDEEFRNAAIAKLLECVPHIQKISERADQILRIDGAEKKADVIEGEFKKIANEPADTPV